MTLVWDCVYCCSDSPVWGDLVPGQNPLRGRLQGQPALRRLWTDRGTYGASPLVWRIRISSDLHYFAGSALLPVWGSGSSEKRLLDLLIRTKFLWITGMRRRLLTHTSFISAKTVVLLVLYNTFSMYTVKWQYYAKNIWLLSILLNFHKRAFKALKCIPACAYSFISVISGQWNYFVADLKKKKKTPGQNQTFPDPSQWFLPVPR